jgi:cytochrome c peroxidase
VTGDKQALDESQLRGLELLSSVGCADCHSGPAFNGWEIGETEPTFEQFPVSSDNEFVKRYDLDQDLGVFAVTKNEDDKHAFKVPTLRNTTLTSPYFHNGAVSSLKQAVHIMSVTELDTELTDQEASDIVAFLYALEGEFPNIMMPRLPSRPGETVLENQEPAKVE